MKLEFLGCSGDVARERRTTAYLLNENVLVDAGTVTDVLSPERSNEISHVFISHIHLDHVKGLCFFAREQSMRADRSITVLADEPVLKALSLHVFNDVLWPDFTSAQDKEHPILRLQTMDPGGDTTVHGLRVNAIPVNHRIYTTGFLVRESETSIVFTSDTGMTEQLWETARREEHLAVIVAHVAFPDRLAHLAERAGHMTPSVLFNRIETYRFHRVPCYVAHLNSIFEEEIREEITRAGRENIRLAEQGSVLIA